MSLFDVVGQKRIADILAKSIKNNRVAHAYIFSGPKGIGKGKMAVEFAKALNCQTEATDACNQCTNCRRIEHENHPAVQWLKPSGNSIKIEQVRELQKEAQFKIQDARMKIYIIEDAERMTIQAANSLLKFLEEPKTPAVFILLVENEHQLLPTVRSRCQLISFPPIDTKYYLQLFKQEGYSDQDILIAASIAEGVEETKIILDSVEFVQMKNLMLQWIKEITNHSYQSLFTINDKIMKSDYIKENLPLFLDLLILWYRDILNIRVNRFDSLIFKDQLEENKKVALLISEAKILNHIDEILQTKRRLKVHVQPQLALEQLVLSIQEG